MNTHKNTIDIPELTTHLRTLGPIRAIAKYFRAHQKSEHSDLIREIVTILNSEDAPSIDLYLDEALEELSGFEFFRIQRILCELMMELHVDQDVLLNLTVKLIDFGGNDLAAGSPGVFFGEWSKHAKSRSQEFYKEVSLNNNLAIRLLYNVLTANSDIEQAIRFSKNSDQDIKFAAMAALASIDLGLQYEETLTALLYNTSSDNDAVALRSLECSYAAAARRKISAPEVFDEKLAFHLKNRTPEAIHLASKLLCHHRPGLSDFAIEICFDNIIHVNPSHTGTISNIDNALYQIISEGAFERAFCIMREIIDSSQGKISFENFCSAYHALQSSGTEILGNAIVFWLLNGGLYTCKSLANAVCTVGNKNPSFTVTASSIPLTPSEQIFLCHRAIGWFFMDPLAAIPIPLAILRHGSPDVKNEVMELIFNPLLMSYSGKLKEYIENYASRNSEINDLLTALLNRREQFNNSLEGIDQLVELHPSEMQLEIDRIRWDEKMRISMKQSRDKSILNDICTTQYILYGRSSLASVYTETGAADLREVEMATISIETELPLLNIIDPISLDHMLRHFRIRNREMK